MCQFSLRALAIPIALTGWFASLAAAQNPAQPPAPQIARDVLVGRVAGPNGAIQGATVTVFTGGPADTTKRQVARTDEEGRWLSAVQLGVGEYTVRAIALGMSPRTATAKRVAVGKAIIVDFKLEVNPVTLVTVNVVAATRQQPAREQVVQDFTSAQTFTGGFRGSIASADQGSLAAMAASVPGVILTPDAGGGVPGFSVLGLSSSQNSVTLNGVAFGGGDIPRDGFVSTRVAATSYDVSRGGFSGGQLGLVIGSGGNFATRLLHVSFDGPSLQATDRVGRRMGQEYTNAQLSGAAAGALVLDKVFYNFSFQAGRRNSDLISLLSSDPFALQRVGVSSDSVSRLVTAATVMGIPVTAVGMPTSRVTDNASVLGRIDWGRNVDTTRAYITGSLRYNTAGGTFLGGTGAPAHGGDSRTAGADVSGQLSRYLFGTAILNDLSVAARLNDVQSDPYTIFPNVSVRVTSNFDDGTAGTTSLALGGNAALPRNVRTSGAELRDQASWISLNNNHHRIRAGFALRQDAFSQDQYVNRRGTFAFNSIDDLIANRPAAFSRSFVSRQSSAGVFTGSAYAGDDWRPTTRIQVLYGLRMDGNRFADRPQYNAGVEQSFGVRSDFTPNLMAVSPRAGFSWLFGNNGTTGIPGFGAPWGQLRGGFGLFRNDVAPTLIAPALLASGLGTSVTQVNCVGAAIPSPDWNAYWLDPSAVPSACAVGTGGTVFASTQPNVLFVDRYFAAQVSRRASLAISGFLIPHQVLFSIEGIYSTNLHQQAPLDLNFNGVQRFSLANEASRPVFAAPSSFVPTSGAVTNRDSRLDPAFGSVTALKSDLGSVSRQISLTVNPFGPALIGRFYNWSLGYTLASVRDEVRGYAGTTAGDPRAAQWGRGGSDYRHQVIASLYARLWNLISVGGQARFLSGAPYTPIVSGDLNGDGLSNDRAFVFDPASAATDPLVQSGMTALLASAEPRVRGCLQGQMGRIASRNSCEGPWTSTLNAIVTLNPEKLGNDNRMQVSLSLTNVPAGLDALLHRNLHGWGQLASSENNLLTVRGFNPATNAFAYEVNPRFGSTSLDNSPIRMPFLVTLEVRYQLGGEPLHQTVDQTVGQGRTRKGDKLTLQSMKTRILQSVFNPIRGLLQAKDSLSVLTNEQLAQLTKLATKVNAQQDSIVTPLATELVNLPNNFDRDAVTRKAFQVQLRLFDTVIDGMREAGKIFTAEQLEQFPPALTASFNIARLVTLRPRYGFFPNF